MSKQSVSQQSVSWQNTSVQRVSEQCVGDSDLSIRGADLDVEEAAAVVAVLARLAETPALESDAGSTGPTDRTLQRRQRLSLDQHGLWGRQGPASWNQAGGGPS